MLCVGQSYVSSFTVHGLDLAPGSAALVITKPDGTLVAPAPIIGAPTQSGKDWTYTYTYVFAAAGLHQFAWSSASPATAPTPTFENVRAYVAMVSRAEIKQHLNITHADDDDELDAFIMGATEMVESKIGICVARPFTDRVEQGRYRLVMQHRPILSVASVTSVWPGGPQWLTANLRWDAEAGIIDQTQPFPFWWPPWDVVYTCGRPVMAEHWIQACKEQCRHLWENQRGSQPPSLLQGEEVFTATTGWSFSVPRRVLELLEPDMVPSI